MAKKQDTSVKISRKGLMVWGGLVVFIAGWMFVLGILVGRGSAPVNLDADKLEKELIELKAAMTKKAQAKIEASTSGQGADKPELGFYKALKESKNNPPFKIAQPPGKPDRPAPVPVKPTAVAKPKPLPKPTPPPKPVTTPEPAPKSKPAMAATTKALPTRGRFSIQVAAVREAPSAQRLVSDLRRKGFQAYQVRVDVPGKGAWHRVRVGAFDVRSAAQKVLERLNSEQINGMVMKTD